MVKVRNDLTGQHICGTRLTVLYQTEDAVRSGKHYARYMVQCDCGSSPFAVDAADIGRHTFSCGCLAKEVQTKRCKEMGTKNIIHNDSQSRLYIIWANMKARCYNPNSDRYNVYGARGIKVCDEWKNSYAAFQKWALDNGYDDKLTIDRIDVDGNYEPLNCKWSTTLEQANNKTDNVFVEYNGETHTISEWSRITGIKYSTLYNKLVTKKMLPKDVFQQDEIIT